MNRRKYNKARTRCEVIGKDPKQRVLELFSKRKRQPAVRLSNLTGLEESTCRHVLSNYYQGYFVVDISDADGEIRYPRHLIRLALFYQKVLKIPKDDSVIELTREVNPAFVYPLPSIQ